MARVHQLIYALNAGGVDTDAIARVDLEKMRLAGEHPVKNWLPRVIGPMSVRPGLQSLYRIPSDVESRIVPFVRSTSTANILLLSNGAMRILDSDGAVVSYSNASTAVADPNWAGPLIVGYVGGWKNDSPSTAGTAPYVVLTGGTLTFAATPWTAASVQQGIAVSGGDQTKEHTLYLDVQRGPILLRMGTGVDKQDLLAETTLHTGIHQITVTPNAANIYIKLRNERDVIAVVSTVAFAHTIFPGSGPMSVATPWTTAQLRDVSYDQSIDVMFVGDGNNQPRRIERRGNASWSVAQYQTDNGPYYTPPSQVTMQCTGLRGDATLVSNIDFFDSSHIGGLFEITPEEQHVSQELTKLGQYTDYVVVSGVSSGNDDRKLTYAITATGFTGTIVLERSTDSNLEIWSPFLTFTATTGATTFSDAQNNVRIGYRFRMQGYTAGSAVVTLDYLGGSKTAVVRVTGITNATTAQVAIVTAPNGNANVATRNWRGPRWTSTRGWPRVPRLFDGRLWWFGGDEAYGSVVDDYANFDDSVEGDSGPIIRSIGSGATEGAVWALDMQRLIVGTTGFEASIRANSFDEPLTPTAFTVRNASTLGVANVPAVKVDRGAFFVQRSGKRLYEMAFSGDTNDYTSQDVTRLVPSALAAGAVAMAVQRQPDTRLYIVLEDGTCVVLTHERDDKVVAFTTIETDGVIEDVCVLPGTDQDHVYFIVRRNSTQRYVERLAPEDDQRDVDTCILLDAAKVITGPVSSITGGTHLANRTVQVWADGQRRTPVALDGTGAGALGATYNRVVYGLAYNAEFTSVKLAYAASLGTAIGQTKIVKQVAPLLRKSVVDGLVIGRDADHADTLPVDVAGAWRTAGQFFETYDYAPFPIDGDWSADSRVYLKADSSYGPVTVQALVIDIETRDGGNGAKGSDG